MEGHLAAMQLEIARQGDTTTWWPAAWPRLERHLAETSAAINNTQETMVALAQTNCWAIPRP
jgi:hypothetical protein